MTQALKAGVRKITMGKNIQRIAEERCARHYPNLEVLNSYWVGQDGKHKYYEVILIDTHHPAIIADKQLGVFSQANGHNSHRGRAARGLTSAGKRGRGLSRSKGKGAEKAPPLAQGEPQPRQVSPVLATLGSRLDPFFVDEEGHGRHRRAWKGGHTSPTDVGWVAMHDAVIDLDGMACSHLFVTETPAELVEQSIDVAVPWRWIRGVGDVVVLRWFPANANSASLGARCWTCTCSGPLLRGPTTKRAVSGSVLACPEKAWSSSTLEKASRSIHGRPPAFEIRTRRPGCAADDCGCRAADPRSP